MMCDEAINPIYDYSRLMGRIIEKFGTISKFADSIRKTRQHISRILNNKAFLSVNELDLWRLALEIDVEDIPLYFFVHKANDM